MALNWRRGFVIQHSVSRRGGVIRVIVDVDLDAVLLAVAPAEQRMSFQQRLLQYVNRLPNDILEVGDILVSEGEVGTVKFFLEDEGWGFIQAYNSKDIFVHRTGIVGETDGKTLQKGQRVRFVRRQGKQTEEAVEVEPDLSDLE